MNVLSLPLQLKSPDRHFGIKAPQIFDGAIHAIKSFNGLCFLQIKVVKMCAGTRQALVYGKLDLPDLCCGSGKVEENRGTGWETPVILQ